MIDQVLTLIQHNRLQEARALCEQLSRANKKNVDVWLMMADINSRLGNITRARNNYQKAIGIKPDHAPAHARLAMLYHSQGAIDKAEHSYRRALALDDNQPATHYNLGVVFQESERHDQAREQYRKALRLKPDYARAYANLAFILRHQGDLEEAITQYRKALQFAPEVAEIHYNTGLALLDTGQADAARHHFEKAFEIKPGYADALAGIGAVHYFKGDVDKAMDSYRQALSRAPEDVDILCAYASALSSYGEHEQAVQQIERALKITPANTEVLITKGALCMALGQLDDAYACADQVLKRSPQHEKALYVAASICEKRGNAQQAYHYLSGLLKTHSPRVDALLCYASISQALGHRDHAIELMEKRLKSDQTLQVLDQRRLNFSLARAYDNREDYHLAFEHFRAGNELKQTNFDIHKFRDVIDLQIQVFLNGVPSNIDRSPRPSDRPIFIVGMPRSGTSLVEQILTSHPDIAGAGELPDIEQLAKSTRMITGSEKAYPENISDIGARELELIAQTYLDRLFLIDSKAKYVTDKMPGNFMHLGFIQLLFPDARIIHCVRDPADTCLSCYFQDFSRDHPWSYNLQDCGRVYLEYNRLMQHWKDVLEVPILDVHYEELVDDQELVSRRMIEFCGLDWDDACLKFYKNKRFIWTASYDQVRQPMYTRSVARWKNYQPHIEQLRSILGSKTTNLS